METISLKLIDEDLHESLLPHLKGNIFHLTTQDAYRYILEDGRIKHNRDNEFRLNTSSDNSYGRKRGYVCLFNLKGKDKKIIDDTLSRYYFLEPTWFKKYHEDRTESKLIYLILNVKYHHIIIDSEEAKESLDQRVPSTECWIDNHLPIEYIERVVTVEILRSAPKDSFSYAQHMIELESRNNK